MTWHNTYRTMSKKKLQSIIGQITSIQNLCRRSIGMRSPPPMKAISTSRRSWVVKNATDWLPTNKNKHRWKMSRTPKCPFCNTDEDAHHVQICPHPLPTAHRCRTLSSFSEKLRLRHTSPPPRYRPPPQRSRHGLDGNSYSLTPSNSLVAIFPLPISRSNWLVEYDMLQMVHSMEGCPTIML